MSERQVRSVCPCAGRTAIFPWNAGRENPEVGQSTGHARRRQSTSFVTVTGRAQEVVISLSPFRSLADRSFVRTRPTTLRSRRPSRKAAPSTRRKQTDNDNETRLCFPKPTYLFDFQVCYCCRFVCPLSTHHVDTSHAAVAALQLFDARVPAGGRCVNCRRVAARSNQAAGRGQSDLLPLSCSKETQNHIH